MASNKEFLCYVLEQCPDGTTYRAMMEEYILYYREKVFGGIYDDRFLIKPVKTAIARMPHAVYELPYDGAKPMLLVDRLDDRDFLKELIQEMYEQLSAPKKKGR